MNRKGFTLLEVMVALSICFILTLVVMHVGLKSLTLMKKSARRSMLKRYVKIEKLRNSPKVRRLARGQVIAVDGLTIRRLNNLEIQIGYGKIKYVVLCKKRDR